MAQYKLYLKENLIFLTFIEMNNNFKTYTLLNHPTEKEPRLKYHRISPSIDLSCNKVLFVAHQDQLFRSQLCYTKLRVLLIY